jgi:hypothetical protein
MSKEKKVKKVKKGTPVKENKPKNKPTDQELNDKDLDKVAGGAYEFYLRLKGQK